IEFGRDTSVGVFKVPPPHPGNLEKGKRQKPPTDANGKVVDLKDRFRVRMPPDEQARNVLYNRLVEADKKQELLLTNADPSDPTLMLSLLLFVVLPIGMVVFFW